MDKTTNPMLLIPVLGRLLIIAVVVLIPTCRRGTIIEGECVHGWHGWQFMSGRKLNEQVASRIFFCGNVVPLRSSAALSPRYLNDGF
jgi:hypothetical protein